LSNRLGWIGVDIGTRSIKLAQVARTASGVRLLHAAVIQRPHPWTDEDRLGFATPSSSEVEIRAALECTEFRGRNAACVLPMNVCELRGLNIPQGDDHERRAMITNELADDWAGLPYPMEFDYWELEVDRNGAAADAFNVDVLAVAGPWIAQAARDCQHARLDCWTVDGGPLAMARAVALMKPIHSGQRVLAIDWGFSNATICVVGSGGPLYARRIHECSFRSMLDAVTNALGMTLDQAQHVVDVHGVVLPGANDGSKDEIQAAVTTAIAEPVGHLVGEIQRTLHFFDLQRRHLRPSSIVLMGGGASVKNIGPHLSELLALPVAVWNVPSEPTELEENRGGRRALFGNAVALSALGWGGA
jgi:type IV pilus assembly protein PilM